MRHSTKHDECNCDCDCKRSAASDVAFFIFIILLVILFAGEPDIHDAIINYLFNMEK